MLENAANISERRGEERQETDNSFGADGGAGPEGNPWS